METATAGLADELARWATELEPSEDDLALAHRSLLDTVAVMFAAQAHPLAGLFEQLTEAGRWTALAHVLDYDDLHLPSTSAHQRGLRPGGALVWRGGADSERAYLAGAGVMARLGTALGWRALQRRLARDLHRRRARGRGHRGDRARARRRRDRRGDRARDPRRRRRPAGVRDRSQVAPGRVRGRGRGPRGGAGRRRRERGPAGARAMDGARRRRRLSARGRRPRGVQPRHPGGPGGLAIKPFPCCYALQRPIAALLPSSPCRSTASAACGVRTPGASLAPLIHHSPATGLEGKFSLEYGIAAALLDGHRGSTASATRRSGAPTPRG